MESCIGIFTIPAPIQSYSIKNSASYANIIFEPNTKTHLTRNIPTF